MSYVGPTSARVRVSVEDKMPFLFVFPIFYWQLVLIDLFPLVVAFVFSWQPHQAACSLPQYDAVDHFLFLLDTFSFHFFTITQYSL